MKDVVECSHGPACRGDHHGWDCPVSDPMGDVLRPLMDHFTNPILDQSRRALIDGFTNQEGTTVSKDKIETKDKAIAAEAGVAGIPDEAHAPGFDSASQRAYDLLSKPEVEEVEEEDDRRAGFGWGDLSRDSGNLPLRVHRCNEAPTVEAPLDVDQLGRVEALKAARSVLQTSAGLFGGTSTGNHSVDDLIRIARFITTGQDPQ